MKWYSYLPFLDEHTYERYLPTAFDESMTLLQKVNKVIEGLNTVIQAMNKTFEEVDKQNDKITAIRDDFETLKEWLENEGLQERTVWVLNEWFDSGKLAQIINSEVFQMKLDTQTFEDFLTANQTDMENVTNELATKHSIADFQLFLTANQTDMENITNELTTKQSIADFQLFLDGWEITQTELSGNIDTLTNNLTATEEKSEGNRKKMATYVSVTDFGAVGDGVTSDTLAFQQAIDSLANTREATLILPPTNGNAYVLEDLVIPSSIVLLTVQGVGNASIHLNAPIVFHIQTENIRFENIRFKGVHNTIRNEGSCVFKDDRGYSALDFDLNIFNCRFENVHSIVVTKGRGVYIDSCLFQSIPGRIIKINVLPRSEVTEGGEPIQKYEEGYRVYVIKNSRFHYLTNAVLIQTYNDTEKVVNGIYIEGNYIEGGLGYFVGYARDFVFKNNQHYNNSYPWGALFNFNGGEDISIDVNMTGIDSAPYSQVVNMAGDVKNFTLTGSVKSLKHHLVIFRGNTEGVMVDVNVSNVKNVSFSPMYVSFAGSGTTNKGISLRGVFQGTDAGRTLVRDEGSGNTFTQTNVSLLGYGKFAYLSDIP